MNLIKLCANFNKQTHCKNSPMVGHIFCPFCFVSLGGYYRSNVTLNTVWRAPAAA
jgi:hypothetical protein